MSKTPRGGHLLMALASVSLLAASCASTAVGGSPVVKPLGTTAENTSTTSDAVLPQPGSTTPQSSTSKAPAGSTSSLIWQECGEDVVGDILDNPNGGVQASDLDCATVTVPLDYSQPAGRKIDIAMTRWPAAVGGNRIGSLLLNPGGPGGSGQDLLVGVVTQNEAKLVDLHDAFDLIGFDPRGVNGSEGLTCVDGPTLDTQFNLDMSPDTPEEKQALKDYEDLVDNACKAKYSEDFLKQINTENTARDMEQIRIAVGDEKLTYLGISYGTYLGSVYATLFPDKVRAMVLDGAFDPAGEDEVASNVIQLTGFEGAFQNWAAWCATSVVCAFGPGDIDKRWLQLRQQLDDKPINGDDTRTVNQDTFIGGTIASLYQKAQGWPALGAALKAAENGDGSLLLRLADSQAGRKDDGTYDSIGTAFGVISCTSGLTGAPPADKEAAAAQLRGASPHFSATASADDFGSSCEGIPAAAGPTPFVYSGTGPILVIGGKNDPATPFVWAEKMAKALGPKASLLSYAGEGHSTWLESDCTDVFINSTLIELKAVPPTECAAQGKSDATLPAWFKDLPAIPGADASDISDLLPLLGLEPEGLQGRVVLSSQSKSDAAKSAQTALTSAGWKSQGGQNGARTYSKSVGGQNIQMTVLPLGTKELSDSPFTKVISEQMLAGGKCVLLFFAQA
jgi:pimeloyl-ACP methyl ester carboxylesterase